MLLVVAAEGIDVDSSGTWTIDPTDLRVSPAPASRGRDDDDHQNGEQGNDALRGLADLDLGLDGVTGHGYLLRCDRFKNCAWTMVAGLGVAERCVGAGLLLW